MTKYTVPAGTNKMIMSSSATMIQYLLSKNRSSKQAYWQMTFEASLLRITIVYINFHIDYIYSYTNVSNIFHLT